jgi:hypothetical protein
VDAEALDQGRPGGVLKPQKFKAQAQGKIKTQQFGMSCVSGRYSEVLELFG